MAKHKDKSMAVSVSPVAPDTFAIRISDGFREELCSVYVIVGDEVALVETGPAVLADNLLAGLAQLQIDLQRVAKIFVTHVHMDHAGGAGLLARRMPHVQVLVQDRGAKHLIDPTALVAGTETVFGKDFHRDYGTIDPVPANQVYALKDGGVIDLGRGHRMTSLHTPGHAPHHLCLFDEKGQGLFSGEALGHHYAADHAVMICAAPPSFDLEATKHDIARLQALGAKSILFSQVGVAHQPDWIYSLAMRQVEGFGAIVEQALSEEASLPEIRRRLDLFAVENCGIADRAKARVALGRAGGANAEAFVGYFQRVVENRS